DPGVFEIRQRLREGSGGLFYLRTRSVVLRLRRIVVGLRREAGLEQSRLPVEIDFCGGLLDLRFRQIGLSLLDLRLKRRRVELGEELTLFHSAVEVGVEARDDSGDLTADLHRRDR